MTKKKYFRDLKISDGIGGGGKRRGGTTVTSSAMLNLPDCVQCWVQTESDLVRHHHTRGHRHHSSLAPVSHVLPPSLAGLIILQLEGVTYAAHTQHIRSTYGN